MLKHTIAVILREWRQNVALWVELVLVGIFVGYMVDDFVTKERCYREPLGFDTEHVYRLQLMAIPEGGAGYVAQTDTTVRYPIVESAKRLMERLSHLEGVEAVSFSHNSIPFTGNSSFQQLYRDTLGVYAFQRVVSTGFPQVFRIADIDGDVESVVRALEENTVVIGERVATMLNYEDPHAAVGQKVFQHPDQTEGLECGAVAIGLRSSRQTLNTRHILIPVGMVMDEIGRYIDGAIEWMEFTIRVTASADHNFAEHFKREIMGDMRMGNVIVFGIHSMADIQAGYERGIVVGRRLGTLNTAFLLLCAFLGVVGAFWYRTQQRRGEIGVRMALGDTREALQWRYIGEGLLLLVLSLPLVALGLWLLQVYDVAELNWMEFSWRVPIALGATSLVLAVVIAIAVWLPARRAVRISPAIAIRED